MDNITSQNRAVRGFVVTAAIGTVSLLSGLAWDARMHAADAALAAREGVLTLTNPAHLLAAVGVVLVTAGIAGTAWALWLRPGSRRRRVLGAAVLALVPVIGGAVAVSSAAAESHHHDDHSHGEIAAPTATSTHTHATGLPASEGEDGTAAPTHAHDRDYAALWDAVTPAERAGATRLVDDVKASTAAYADVDAARAAGYGPNPRGGPDATHWPSPAAARDGRILDPTRPESLVYWTVPDGRKVLVGALFKVGPGQDAPTPGGDLTMWHVHPAPGELCHPAEDEDCSGTQMLHVYFFDGVVDPFTESPVAAAGGRQAFRADLLSMLSAAERPRSGGPVVRG